MESPGIVYRSHGGSGPAEFARRAEVLGYDSVWVSEGWGEHAPVVLAEMTEATSTIGLGSAIVNVYSRSPAVLAMAAVSLQRVSDGRLRFGLGTSHRQIIEDLHGLPFERPLERLEESIELLRQYLSADGEVEYTGECFEVAGYDALDAEVPIYNAALGPKNRRLTGRHCDGWIPNNIPLSRIDSDFEAIAESARDAGRDPDDIAVMPWVPSAVHDDPESARDVVRESIAFYLGTYPFYRRPIAAKYPDAVERIVDAWEDDRSTASGAVPDGMVQAMGVAGTPDDARRQLRELVEGSVIDTPIIALPPFADDELVQSTMERLAPSGW